MFQVTYFSAVYPDFGLIMLFWSTQKLDWLCSNVKLSQYSGAKALHSSYSPMFVGHIWIKKYSLVFMKSASSTIPTYFFFYKEYVYFDYLFLWTSYQNLFAGSESWKIFWAIWLKRKCLMCVLLGQELVVCRLFLLIRSNFGKKLCMQMYFQSLKVRFQMRIKIPE